MKTIAILAAMTVAFAAAAVACGNDAPAKDATTAGTATAAATDSAAPAATASASAK